MYASVYTRTYILTITKIKYMCRCMCAYITFHIHTHLCVHIHMYTQNMCIHTRFETELEKRRLSISRAHIHEKICIFMCVHTPASRIIHAHIHFFVLFETWIYISFTFVIYTHTGLTHIWTKLEEKAPCDVVHELFFSSWTLCTYIKIKSKYKLIAEACALSKCSIEVG